MWLKHLGARHSTSTGEMGERVRVAGERLRRVEEELEEGQVERSNKYNHFCYKEKNDLILGVSGSDSSVCHTSLSLSQTAPIGGALEV